VGDSNVARQFGAKIVKTETHLVIVLFLQQVKLHSLVRILTLSIVVIGETHQECNIGILLEYPFVDSFGHVV
jgi:hypothetical protein